MSDFTILMDNSKYLVITKNMNLFQGDNYVDNFSILVPVVFNDISLLPFTATLQYVDADNNVYADILEPEEDIYKENYIRYRLPVTTKLTRRAGEIKATLSLNWVDQDKLIQYSLHTSEVKIYIHASSDYYKFNDSSLKVIDQKIGELASKADYLAKVSEEIMKSSAIDDLGFDEDGILHLTSKGEYVGNGVDGVATVGTKDNQDEIWGDGIIDADEIYKEVTL